MTAVINAALLFACVSIAFAVIASIAAVVERLPSFPPDYTDDDVLPPPNVRCQRSGRESH